MIEANRIALLGLGNLMRTDDAFGMLTVERLARDPRLPLGVRVIEGGTLGLDLLGRLDDVTHLIAMDAVETGSEPGRIVRYANEELVDLPVAKSVHLLGFADLLGVLSLLGDAPREVVVLGVQPDRIEWGTELTQSVAAAQDAVVEQALAQVEEWLHPLPLATAAAGLEAAIY